MKTQDYKVLEMGDAMKKSYLEKLTTEDTDSASVEEMAGKAKVWDCCCTMTWSML